MDKEELIRNFCVAASAAIPVAGGTLSVLLDKYLPNKIEERKQNVLDNILKDLSKIDMRLLENKFDNEEFYTVFLKILNKSIMNHREEKLIAFRNILINDIVKDSSEFDEISLFIRLTDELTVDQIRILNLFYKAYVMKEEKYIKILKNSKNGLNKKLKAVWKDVDEDYLMSCSTELIRFWLLLGSSKSKRENGIEGFSLSGLGRRFSEYIFLPIHNDIHIEDEF